MTDYERIRRSCLKRGELWEDPEFPATQASVFYHQTPSFQFVWKRPKVRNNAVTRSFFSSKKGNFVMLFQKGKASGSCYKVLSSFLSFLLFSPSYVLRFMLLPYSTLYFFTSLFYLYFSPFNIYNLIFSFTLFFFVLLHLPISYGDVFDSAQFLLISAVFGGVKYEGFWILI
jgi:hypothetical protein